MVVVWLIDQLIVWFSLTEIKWSLTDWLNAEIHYWLTDRFTYHCIDWLVDLLVDWLIDWLIDTLATDFKASTFCSFSALDNVSGKRSIEENWKIKLFYY